MINDAYQILGDPIKRSDYNWLFFKRDYTLADDPVPTKDKKTKQYSTETTPQRNESGRKPQKPSPNGFDPYSHDGDEPMGPKPPHRTQGGSKSSEDKREGSRRTQPTSKEPSGYNPYGRGGDEPAGPNTRHSNSQGSKSTKERGPLDTNESTKTTKRPSRYDSHHGAGGEPLGSGTTSYNNQRSESRTATEDKVSGGQPRSTEEPIHEQQPTASDGQTSQDVPASKIFEGSTCPEQSCVWQYYSSPNGRPLWKLVRMRSSSTDDEVIVSSVPSHKSRHGLPSQMTISGPILYSTTASGRFRRRYSRPRVLPNIDTDATSGENPVSHETGPRDKAVPKSRVELFRRLLINDLCTRFGNLSLHEANVKN